METCVNSLTYPWGWGETEEEDLPQVQAQRDPGEGDLQGGPSQARTPDSSETKRRESPSRRVKAVLCERFPVQRDLRNTFV